MDGVMSDKIMEDVLFHMKDLCLDRSVERQIENVLENNCELGALTQYRKDLDVNGQTVVYRDFWPVCFFIEK